MANDLPRQPGDGEYSPGGEVAKGSGRYLKKLCSLFGCEKRGVIFRVIGGLCFHHVLVAVKSREQLGKPTTPPFFSVKTTKPHTFTASKKQNPAPCLERRGRHWIKIPKNYVKRFFLIFSKYFLLSIPCACHSCEQPGLACLWSSPFALLLAYCLSGISTIRATHL